MKHLFETEIEMEWLTKVGIKKQQRVKYAKRRTIILDKKLFRIKNYKKNTSLVLFKNLLKNLRKLIPN